MARSIVVASIVVASGLVGAAALLTPRVDAGPLNPPAGPVAGTYKTLTEVEPRIPISGPANIISDGSYYLTGNITATAGGDGITISAANVTLDLNGYTISGGQTGILIPITLTAGNIIIQNGTVRNTTGSGIFSSPASFGVTSPPTTVRNVRLQNITDACVFLGALSVIDNVSVTGANGSTTSSGITVGAASRITDVRINNVALRGIDASASAIIDRAAVITAGGDGVRAGFSSRISNSNVQSTGIGYNLGQHCTIVASTAANTAGIGFQLDVGGAVKDCNANNINGDAYSIGVGGTVLDSVANTVAGKAFVSTFAGGVTFDRCTAYNIKFDGFQLSRGCIVTNSTVTLIGLLSTFGGPISSGVITTGEGNRIEGNRFVSCGYPVFIAVGSAKNSVYRNAAITNLNGYTNNGGATNQIGPIRVDVLASGPWDNTFQ